MSSLSKTITCFGLILWGFLFLGCVGDLKGKDPTGPGRLPSRKQIKKSLSYSSLAVAGVCSRQRNNVPFDQELNVQFDFKISEILSGCLPLAADEITVGYNWFWRHESAETAARLDVLAKGGRCILFLQPAGRMWAVCSILPYDREAAKVVQRLSARASSARSLEPPPWKTAPYFFPGRITGRDFPISAKEDGVVTKVFLEEGETVKKGQDLLELDGRKIIKAPVSGVIELSGRAYPGSAVRRGDCLASCVNMDIALVLIAVPFTDIDMIFPGNPMEIIVDAMPDRAFIGKIESISPISGNDIAFHVNVLIANDSKLLKKGMSARGRIRFREMAGK